MNRLIGLALLLAPLLTIPCLAAPNIKIVFGLSYDSINPTTRTFGLWYDSSSHSMTDPNMPIFVYIHGGAWHSGGAYGKLGQGGSFAPGVCPNGSTVVCNLAARGYAVYSINHTLALPGVAADKWPVQWQDCECFLKFLAEEAGVSVPGNPKRIIVMGISSGAHLALMSALVPHNTFPTNCSHTSLNYVVEGAIGAAAPLDLNWLYSHGAAMTAISNLLGCAPVATDPACQAIAAAASPVHYVAQGQPEVLIETGFSDPAFPWASQGQLQAAYAALSPPMASTWAVFGDPPPPTFGHQMDLLYVVPCSSFPEPDPCGSAGAAFGEILKFIRGF